MALAAAWFETGEDPTEGESLRWLGALDAPDIVASGHTTRSPVVSYVPVNDSCVKETAPTTGKMSGLMEAGLSVLPEHRPRRARGFPVAIPHDPTVYFVWQTKQLGAHRLGLESLATKVTHVGHSASLVQAWVAEDDEVTTPTWKPTEGVATHQLRTFSPGRLNTLAQIYNKAEVLEYADLKAQEGASRGREKTRIKTFISERFGSREPKSLRPTPTRWQGYARSAGAETPDVPSSVFDPNLVVLLIKSGRVSLTTTLRLTQALRGALMNFCPVTTAA